MNTLIINGSTRKNGDTDALLAAFLSHLTGNVRILSADDAIAPCRDCRFCMTHSGCAIRDGMTEIDSYLLECDNVVLASPVWFSSLSGPALNLASRFQTFFSSKHFRGETLFTKPKNGVVLLCGAQPGSEEGAVRSARIILKTLGVSPERTQIIRSMNTDILPASLDTDALKAAAEAAMALQNFESF